MTAPYSNRPGILFIYFLLVTLNFIACKKISTTEPPLIPPGGDTTITHDLSAKVSSSVSGFVIDESNKAVTGAIVNMGTSNTVTDKYGFFEITNTQVVKEAAMVSVEKAGYLKGIKTYVAAEGKAAFFRIKLLSKTIAGNIDASTGGNVALPVGLIIGIPANAVVNAVTKANYSGNITVSARWINPEDNELVLKMPGDLRGLDSAGKIKLLATYGMAAVELRGSNGELLQIADGKKAILTIPMSATMGAKAPGKIPLWYLDETNGLWKQEGFATKSGNNYTGDVSHFSFWNCDVPNSYIHFNCKIVNAAGQPIQNALVRISLVSDSLFTGNGFTDASGYVSGSIPDNSQLLLQVFTGFICAKPVAVKNFSTTSADISLGDITASNQTAAVNASVTGTVINCNSTPITNGYIIVQSGLDSYRYAVGADGKFNFNTTVCDPGGTSSISIIPEDVTATQTGSIKWFSINPGSTDLGQISTCSADSLVEFSCVLVNTSGSPVPNIWVRIIESANTLLQGWGYSDSNGMVTQYIKENTAYLLEVYGTRNCGTLLFSKSFSSSNSNISLGNFTIGALTTATVTGSIVDCSGTPITNGYLIVQKSNHDIRIPLNSNGSFNFTTPVCNNTGNTPVVFVAVENNGMQGAINLPAVISEGNNSLGALKACTDIVSSIEFVNYSFDGKNYSFVSPTDSFRENYNSPSDGYTSLTASKKLRPDSSVFHFAFFPGVDKISVGATNIGLDELSFPSAMDRFPTPPNAKVYFTEVGAIGQYIAGGFTAEVHPFPSDPYPGQIYEVSCSFRIKRKE